MLTKKFLRAAVMLLVMMLTTTTAWADSTFSGGDGSQGNPYQIKTTADLDKLAQDVNSGIEYANTFFLLANDIAYEHTSKWNDATSTENNYTAIGYYDYENDFDCYFRGTFDGNNKTISGIRIYKKEASTTDSNQGVFGQLGKEGTVKNLTLADSRITGFAALGGIVGYCLGSIVNCTALATVFVSPNGVYEEDESEDYGGIAGFNDGSVCDCTSLATIAIGDDAEYCEYIGGIVGYSQGIISNCTSSGTITIGKGTSECMYIGGIVGFSFADSSISNCSSATTITIGDNADSCLGIGGIAGFCKRAIINCTSLATITIGDNVNTCARVGGIGGMCIGSVSYCVSSVTISIGSNPEICNWYGGIVGYNEYGSLTHNLANNVTISGQNYLGAILGFDEDGYGTFANNYYSGCTVNGTPTAAGVGFNGADLEVNDGAVPATILSDEGASLPSSLSGKVAFRREFKADKASTVVFPFEYEKGTEGTYYTFNGVSYDSNVGKWKATMTEYTGATLTANTPYLFVPAGTDGIVPMLFHGEAAASISAGTTTQGDWQFKGVYAKKTWAAADCGRDYGFAATSGKAVDGVTDVEAGDFVKLAEGASLPPMRSYLTYTGSDNPWATTNAPGHRAGTELPQSISVVLVSANGEATNLENVQRSMFNVQCDKSWFDLSGRKLDKQPTAKGLYINNGRKVVVK